MPVVFQPADMGKWVAAVEAVTNTTPTYTSNERVKVFNSADGAVMVVCPAHAAKLTCIGASGFTVTTVIKSPQIPIPGQNPTRFQFGERYRRSVVIAPSSSTVSSFDSSRPPVVPAEVHDYPDGD